MNNPPHDPTMETTQLLYRIMERVASDRANRPAFDLGEYATASLELVNLTRGQSSPDDVRAQAITTGAALVRLITEAYHE